MASGQYAVNIGRKVWQNVRLDINKYAQHLAVGYADSARQQLKNWERRVYDKLSDRLPRSEWHKLRDPNRLFPFANTGKQLSSIDSGVKFNITGSGNFSITSWAEIGVPYAEFTSQGYKPRKDGVEPKWIGWMDDVFKGTRGFYSMEDVFEMLTLERAGLV